MNSKKKGFTLIELLIVIGILAVLATITVLVLNPAQLFAQARDSQRISDMGSIKGALSLYLTTVGSPDLDGTGSLDCSAECYTHLTGVTAAGCGRNHGSKTATVDNDRTTDGAGWIPVVLDDTTGGSPLSVLPIDPNPDLTYTRYYTYACNNTALTFEVTAEMESERYSNGGDDDVENTDGGNSANAYEVGIEPGLDI